MSAPDDQMRGIYTIPATPFDDEGNLDFASLEQEIRFCLECGAHGIVYPVNASEYWTLTDDERKQAIKLVVQAVDGRIPTVAGVAANSAQGAAAFGRFAQEVGASAVIAMPPLVRPLPEPAIFAYYRELSRAVSIPIFIQNHEPPMGTRMSAEFVMSMVKELEHVDYIKEETIPAGHSITKELSMGVDKLKGVMGGMAGRFLMDEYRRGSCGNMPACTVTDVHVQVWEALEAGDERRARDTLNALMPMLNVETLLGGAVYKQVLVERGVIRSNYTRIYGGNPLDEFDRQEIRAVLSDLRPYLRGWLPR